MSIADDRFWLKDGDDFGWKLPPKAPWWLRLPVVRRFRALVVDYRIARHREIWGAVGMAASGYDDWVLYAIRRGWV